MELDKKDLKGNLETIKQEQRDLVQKVISTETCRRLEMGKSGLDKAVIDAVNGSLASIVWDIGDKMQMFEGKLNKFDKSIATMKENNSMLHRNLLKDALRMERRNLILHRTLIRDVPRFWAKKLRSKLFKEMMCWRRNLILHRTLIRDVPRF